MEITVRLTPRSSVDRVEGLLTGADGATHLAARVRAVPESGKANAALEKLIAQWTEMPKRSVAVTGGTTSRIKTVFIAGDAPSLELQLLERVKEAGARG
ncbi:MAG: DUF167 family protein [Rhizobiaceae bacterium]|nr:DUF167 family protein [Rhizobiaceae bacterium]